MRGQRFRDVYKRQVLATGGTMAAAYNLVKSMNPKKIYINFIIELSALDGRRNLPAEADVTSLIVC